VAGNYTSLADANDRVYTITDTGLKLNGRPRNTTNQTFAIGWPIENVAAVPEPAIWALMLIGFGAVGTALRREQRQTALAAA